MFFESFLFIGSDSLAPADILHEVDHDDDEHDPVHDGDESNWENEAKPEWVACGPAAEEQREGKPLQCCLQLFFTKLENYSTRCPIPMLLVDAHQEHGYEAGVSPSKGLLDEDNVP